jgi:hypothetical protein
MRKVTWYVAVLRSRRPLAALLSNGNILPLLTISVTSSRLEFRSAYHSDSSPDVLAVLLVLKHYRAFSDFIKNNHSKVGLL